MPDPIVVEPSSTPEADSSQPEASNRTDSDPKKEVGGPKGPDPTRYGDWEKAGRCIDF